MKQILQNLRDGETMVCDVPAPGVAPGRVLIRTRASLVSAGTERMLVEFGRASLLGKAKAQPEKVRQVLDKIRTDGVLPTLEAVFRRLDEPMPLGYCNAGVVLEVGAGVTAVQPGDRVASNGPHAEVVSVPENLCAKVPDSVTDEQAAFTVLSSIALQGVRLVEPQLGEMVVVYGLGLIGLITVQLLKANGCQVLGVDVDPDRLRLAETLGARVVDAGAGDALTAAEAWTAGRGVDAVLITAAAKTDKIVHNAAQMCRKRGRIVLVGVVGLDLKRSDFYEKELTFQVSCSYGPGRYDENYEQQGHDYPHGFVRWTEQRNFQAVLEMLRSGQLDVAPLITHRFDLSDAPAAYAVVSEGGMLGTVLRYGGAEDASRSSEGSGPATATDRNRPQSAAIDSEPAQAPTRDSRVASIGIIGAGLHAKATLVPALARTSAQLLYIADVNGVAAQHVAGKHGVWEACTDHGVILADPEVHAVVITVPHHLHASLVCESLKAGKHVFVEKPLALSEAEVEQVGTALAECQGSVQCSVFGVQDGEAGPDSRPATPEFGSPNDEQRITSNESPILLVGFNRRFSPHSVKMAELLAGRSQPLCMTMTINAGAVAAEHWIQDRERGGGRVIGEACHFIDLLSFLAGSPVVTVAAMMIGEGPTVRDDKIAICLTFADGSIGTVNYFANGSKRHPKEMLEVYSEGRVLKLTNFRELRGFGFAGFRRFRTWRQDKGHRAEMAAFVAAVANGEPSPIPFEQAENVTRASFAAVESARTGQMIGLASG